MRFGVYIMLFGLIAAPGPAFAQWGIGLAPGQRCPFPYAPAPGAINGQDQMANLRGRYDAARAQLNRAQAEMQALDARMARARAGMGKVLPSPVIAQIEEHRRFGRGYNSYWDCPNTMRGAVPQSPAMSLPQRNAGIAVAPLGEGTARVYPPEEFCVRGLPGGTFNAWKELVEENGLVNPQVCDHIIPGFRGRPPPERARDCREGLHELYQLIDRRMMLETRRAQLDGEVHALERQSQRLQEEIAEGTYCPFCGRRGIAQNQMAGALTPMFSMLSGAGSNMWQAEQRIPPVATYPAPGAYPGNPYPTVTPGYYGVNNGVYGALPGSIGRGSFGCAGTQPIPGNAFAPAPPPFLNTTTDPFTNPFRTPLLAPGQQNPLLMPGFGPGFGPQVGGPALSPVPPLTQGDPFLNLQRTPGPAPLGQPLLQPVSWQNPFFQQPYQYLGGPPPGANPLWAAGAWGTLPPTTNPGYFVSNYGAPYAAAHGNAAMVNYPAGGQIVSNYYWQMDMMRQNLINMQNSPVYGGSPPAVLPLTGPVYSGFGGSPIYNRPGSAQNPMPLPLAPPPPPPSNRPR